ncbi:unnamed protein product [Camellia sinensis]
MNFPNSKPKILITLILSFHFFTISTSQQIQQPTTPNLQNALLDEAIDDAINKPQKNYKALLEQQEFLSAHNKARLHIGEPVFIWDTSLALFATQFTRQRAADCALIHSNGPYGENIFWGSGNQWTPTDVVRLWIKEHKFYDRTSNSCANGKICGHYTQIVWRDSMRLGCARVQCNSGDVFAICTYDPPGNYVDEQPLVDHRS